MLCLYHVTLECTRVGRLQTFTLPGVGLTMEFASSIKCKQILGDIFLCGQGLLGVVAHHDKNSYQGTCCLFHMSPQNTHRKEIWASSVTGAKHSWLMAWRRTIQPTCDKQPLILWLAEGRIGISVTPVWTSSSVCSLLWQLTSQLIPLNILQLVYASWEQRRW